MATQRRLIDAALCERFCAAMQAVSMPEGWPASPKVSSQTNAPQEVPSEGEIVIGKGRLSSRIVEFGAGPGGAVRECTYTVPVGVTLCHEYPEKEPEALDAIETAIGEAIFADTSLGGLVDVCDVTTLDEQETGDDTTALGQNAQLIVTCIWHATNPLA